MKTIFTFMLVLLLGSTGFSQQSAKAKKILDKLTEKTKKYTSIKADFSYTLENIAEKINDSYDGQIYLKKKMYKVDLMGVTTYCDGKTIWSHMVDEEEVNISDVSEQQESLLDPSKIFTIYNEDFKYKFKREFTEKGRRYYEIDLYPKSLKEKYSIIRLVINKKKMELKSIKTFYKDGNRYLIEIKKFEANLPMSNSMFAFDPKKYPEAELIDLR